MRTDPRPADVRTDNEARCRRLLAKSELLRVEDLDWASVGTVEVSADVLDTLVYMRDVEGFTDSYATGLAAHKTTLADPVVHAFIEVWTSEEAAHSRAIARYLDLYAAVRAVEVPAQPASPAPAPRWYERALTHLGGPVGRLVGAAHMTWGAANELLTMNGYRLLAAQTPDPVLRELLTRIAAQESRHYSFYLLQAEWRLATSSLARRVLPRFLGGSWTPVGIGEGYKTDAEFRRVLEVLTAQPDSARIIDRMDRRFARLPGLDGLQIFRDATRTPVTA